MSKLKIRCSALGKIMAGATLDPLPLTEAQERTLAELMAKIKLTEKQAETRDQLIAKKETPPELKLSTGAKSYIEQLWYENKFDYREEFSSKYTAKGNAVERHSLDELSKFIGVKCFKNIRKFENDYIVGTPDTLLKQFNTTIDAKNVYLPKGLDFFKEKDEEILTYVWQIHAYNWLTGNTRGFVVRMLMNPPDEIIEQEVWTRWKNVRLSADDYPTDEFRESVKWMFDFESKLPFEERHTFKEINTGANEIILIQKMVELAREYWEELNDKFSNRNTIKL
jgi:hypothetical protein